MTSRPTRSSLLLLAALACVFPVGGCASTRTVPSQAVFGEDTKPAGPVEASKVFLPTEGAILYHIVEGADAGDTILIEQKPGAKADEWIVTRTPSGDEAPLRTDRLRQEKDGSIVLLETESRDEKVISRYEPPLVVLPARLAAGDAVEQRVELTVRPIEHPDQIDHRGPATNQIKLAAGQDVKTPAGQFASLRVDAVFKADLSAAKVVNKTSTWYAPDLGMIAERYDDVAKTLGITVNQHRHFYVIRERQR